MKSTSLLFLIINLIGFLSAHDCGHDHLQRHITVPEEFANGPVRKKPKTNERVMQTSTQRPFKLVIDYGDNPDSNGNHEHEAEQRYYQDIVFPGVADYYSRVMKKQNPSSFGDNIPPFSSTWCNWVTVPNKQRTQSTNADMLVLLELKTQVPYAGAAAGCLLDTNGDYRPYVCHITINLDYVSFNPLNRIKDHYLLLHEIGHCLGFSSDDYQFYPNNQNNEMISNKTVNMNGTSYDAYYFTSPTLLQTIRDHANDQSIDGVQIETQGGNGSAGSHFEKLHYNNEAMVAQLTGYESSSKFWLALLKDMGWYDVDMGFAEPFEWGRDEGTDFYNNANCNGSNANEYCSTAGAYNCNQSFHGKTRCRTTSFSDNCLIKENFENIRIYKTFQ